MNSRREGFACTLLPTRVIFGIDVISEVGSEVSRLDRKRALILCTPQQIDLAQSVHVQLGDRSCGLFDQATMHTPKEVTDRAMAFARAKNADCVVSVGGGSTTGLGKAIAARTDLPQIVIPTTYAGSEMTPILGETAGAIKSTRRGPEIQPETVIYDVRLTLTLPASLSATSGMNAIAHSVEALYAKNKNPLVSIAARESIRSLAGALPRIVANTNDIDARYDALYGAWLGGLCLGAVDMAFHHKICHTLGGTFNLPHSETHAIMLPYSVAYVAAGVPQAIKDVADALGRSDGNAAVGLYELGRVIGVPQSLASIGMPADGLERAAELAVMNPYWNPTPVNRESVRVILGKAYEGISPAG